jgi:hypothetical protein
MPLTLSPGLSLPSRRRPEAILARTRTFRDRVKNESGEIEEESLEGLYDPILKTTKGFSGVGLSDLVLFVSASAIENNAGSIPKLFDASGNENDATQSDTAKQPALDKNSIGGRWGASFDGGDDEMVNKNSLATSPSTHFWTASLNKTPDVEHLVDGNQNNSLSTRQIVRVAGSNDKWGIYNGKNLLDGAADQNNHIFEVVFDGKSSEFIIDGTSVAQGDAENGRLEDLTIGSRRGGSYWNGLVNEGIIFDAKLSSNQRSTIRNHIQDWYSL